MNDEATSSGQDVASGRRRRIGLVATDALRVLGLQTIFGVGADISNASSDIEIVPLSVPGVLNDVGLSIVLIDAGCTDHLLELVATFRRMRPLVRLIVIGESIEPGYIEKVIGAGARGYLTQTAKENEIRMALDVVADGSVWAPRKVLARLLDASYSAGAAEVTFTERELAVLRLLVAGMSNRQIAEELSIDVTTVKAHLTRLMRKTRVKNRVELSLVALKRNLSGEAS